MPVRRKSLDEQKGNLTKEQQEELKLQESIIKTGSEQLKKLPVWLRDETARKEWKRLKKQFDEMDIISNLDYNNLGAYCNAFSSYLEITDKMKGQPFIVPYVTKTGATNMIPSPFIQAQLKYSEEMRKYSAFLGLSIDSRLKLADLKVRKAKGEIEDDFGDL